MGRFQKVKGEDDEEEEHALVSGVAGGMEVDGQVVGQEHWRPAGLCLGCLTPKEGLLLCTVSALFGTVALAVVCIAVNAVARQGLALVATTALGTRTTIGGVRMAVLDGWSTVVSDVSVEDPDGMGGSSSPFMEMREGLVDLRLPSLLSSLWELKDITLLDVRINVEQTSDADSNARRILGHLMNITTTDLHGEYALDDSWEARRRARDLRQVSSKLVVNELSCENVSLAVCIQPLCGQVTPAPLPIRRILVRDIGKKQGGIFLHELIQIVVQALLVAAIHAAPLDAGRDMHKSFGDALRTSLDYGGLNLDLGQGLADITEWTRWQLGRLAAPPDIVEVLENTSAALADNLVGDLAQQGGLGGGMADAIKDEEAKLVDEVHSVEGNASKAVGLLVQGVQGIISPLAAAAAGAGSTSPPPVLWLSREEALLREAQRLANASAGASTDHRT